MKIQSFAIKITDDVSEEGLNKMVRQGTEFGESSMLDSRSMFATSQSVGGHVITCRRHKRLAFFQFSITCNNFRCARCPLLVLTNTICCRHLGTMEVVKIKSEPKVNFL